MDATTLTELAGADLATVLQTLGGRDAPREPVTGYENLTGDDLEAIDTPSGARVYVRGDEVLVIYVGVDDLPDDVTHDALVEALGGEGDVLASRQGKRAALHVVAERGVAWSVDGEVGFVEVFPPSDLATYRREIYRKRSFKR